MAEQQRASSGGGGWRFVFGILFGIGLTYAYVRFGYQLPGVFTLGNKLVDEAAITTAEVDLYDFSQPLEVRERALSVVLSHHDGLLLELNRDADQLLLREVLRRKATREMRLLKQQHGAYDMAMDKPALRDVLERKHGTNDEELLKQRMLLAAFHDNEFLVGYKNEYLGELTDEELFRVIMSVYQHDLKRPLEYLAERQSAEEIVR